MNATTTADFVYNLLHHADSYYAISAAISFSATTVYDKGTLRKLLQTVDSVIINALYQEDEIDMGNPITEWIEALFLAAPWDDSYLPSHLVSDDASLANIDQVLRIVAHASLAAVKLWLGHMALVPTDRWVRVDAISSNYLILDSTMGAVLDSKDGGPSTAATHDPTEVIGTPRFRLDPEGTNMTVVTINDVSGDQRTDLVDLELTFRPRTKLHF